MRVEIRRLMAVACCGLFSFFLCAEAQARTITIDGNPTDWRDADSRMNSLAQNDLGFIGRNAAGDGEYIWKDREGDQRTDLGEGKDYDMTEFRVTGDATYFYFMATFSSMQKIGGQGTPLLIVTLDKDQVANSGQTALPAFGNTQVASNAAWEVALETRFGYRSDDAKLRVSNADWSSIRNAGNCVLSPSYAAIECRIAWSELRDTTNAPISLPAHLRLTASVFASNNNGEIAIAFGPGSYALDVLTNYGNPGVVENSWNELLDQVINYSFDLFFNDKGNVIAPLVVSELYYDATEPTTDMSEFVEFYNMSGITLNASDYKLTDADSLSVYGANEGAVVFPSGATFADKQVVVWTNSCGDYQKYFGYAPSFAYQVGSTTDCPAAPPLTPTYTPWLTASSGGQYGRIALGNAGDAILLLDRADTVIDAVPYKAAPDSWNQVNFGNAGAAQGKSLRRKDAASDTNDILADFATEAVPNPGVVDLAEICNNADDDHDGITDNVSGTCYTGLKGICAEGLRQCSQGVEICTPLVLPDARSESCDGLDNDCDGKVDNIQGSCSTGLKGVCAEGKPVCKADASVECSVLIAPGEKAETCDGLDNDCDDVIDNVNGAGVGCSAGIGGCQRTGFTACGEDAQLVCGAVAGEPTSEVCNKVDDNCDGTTDNVEGLGAFCTAGVGECLRTGKKVCSGNALICDTAAGLAQDETCNGRDDDCNGTTDNGGDALCTAASCQTMRCKGLEGCVGTALTDWTSCGIGACFAGQCQALADNDTCETATLVVGEFSAANDPGDDVKPHLYWSKGLSCFSPPWSAGVDLFYDLRNLDPQKTYDLELRPTGAHAVGLVFWSDCAAQAVWQTAMQASPGQPLTLTGFVPSAERAILQILLPSAADAFRLSIVESATASDGDATETEHAEILDGDTSEAEPENQTDGDVIEREESELSDGDTSEAESADAFDGDAIDNESDDAPDNDTQDRDSFDATDTDTADDDRSDGDTTEAEHEAAADGEMSDGETIAASDGDAELDAPPIAEKGGKSGCQQSTDNGLLMLMSLLGLAFVQRRRCAR